MKLQVIAAKLYRETAYVCMHVCIYVSSYLVVLLSFYAFIYLFIFFALTPPFKSMQEIKSCLFIFFVWMMKWTIFNSVTSHFSNFSALKRAFLKDPAWLNIQIGIIIDQVEKTRKKQWKYTLGTNSLEIQTMNDL